MAKIKVGPPAVSRYHQLKIIFPTNDQPNFGDHDFPIPGYLLSPSGYMFLDHNNFVESNELFDNDETEPDEKDQNVQLFSYNLFKIKEKSINIFEVVKDQIDLHLSIKADIEEIKEVVKKVITENKTIYVDENIDSDVAIHKILTNIKDNENLNFDKIILAIASLFYTNVVLFDSTTD